MILKGNDLAGKTESSLMDKATLAFLESLRDGRLVGLTEADPRLPAAIEALQRGWVCAERPPTYVSEGRIGALVLRGLTQEGWEAIDRERAAIASGKPSARLRNAFLRAGKWALSGIDRIILAALCSETLFRWIVRLFFSED